jgi:hypothetical protein
MMQMKLFFPTVCVLICVAVLNMIAMIFHLFWTIMWFDMIMHFLGGLFVGLSVCLLFEYIWGNTLSYSEKLYRGLPLVLLVGLLWEGYELLFHMTDFYSPDYFADSGMDVVMDVWGGLVAIIYSHNKIKK